MNVRSIPNFVSAASLAAVLQIGTSAAHASAAPAVPLGNDAVIQEAQPMAYEWTEEKRMQLRRAYWLLEHANANYEGHKAKAMEHIKKAGERFGIELHGKGYEGEHKQGTSDERLREAKEELQKVFRESNSKELPHIENAIKEINHALKVN
ncbi:MAG TPA: hypothetical protein VHZ30_03825 [Verrucomicrobiae bacterium]|nr:hypothetical protein [Verrucomicrobiae bacterium]